MSAEERQTPEPVISKNEVIARLRQAIARLERLVEQVDQSEDDRLNLGDDFAAFNDGLEQLSTTLTATPARREPSPESAATPAATRPDAAPTAPEASSSSLPPQSSPTPTSAPGLLDSLLTRLRGLLPVGLSESLSDGALSSLAIAALVGVFVLAIVLLPGGDRAADVVESPPALTPLPAIETTPTAIDDLATEPGSAPEIPAELEAEPVGEPPPAKPKSSPPLRLTPEQTLIAAIQNQVADITEDYADGLIRSIRADFVGDQLVVTVGDEWYGLTAARQDQLANEMLGRSRQLDFSKLVIDSLTGDHLARSPVVGDKMVVFQRQLT
ncbi:MAG: hypothetical protein HC910_05870 [Spirulinaceae cyanobacterium SM2_1_0]|nr:hypothetical protein [Spirulinaceae cyanobacterium SM2_1_0]